MSLANTLVRKIKAGIDYVRANAAIDYVRAKAVIDYVNAHAAILLVYDPKNFKLPAIFFSVIDVFAKTIGKVFVETVSTADAYLIQFTKGVADSVSLTEDVTVSAIFKEALEDSVSLAGVITKDFTIGITDFLTLVDESSLPTGEINANVINSQTMVSKSKSIISDIITSLHYGIEETNVVSLTDVLINSISKSFAESIGTSDVLTSQFIKGIAESVSISEVLTSQFTKPLTESISVTEAAALHPNKPITDSISFTEAVELQPTKGITDSISFTEEVTTQLN